HPSGREKDMEHRTTGGDRSRMRCGGGLPKRQWAGSGRMLGSMGVALTLVLSGSPMGGHATSRLSSANRESSANVFVQPYLSGSLWFEQLDPQRVNLPKDSQVVQMIYAGLVKAVYDEATSRMRIVPDLAASMPTVSDDGTTYTFRLRE